MGGRYVSSEHESNQSLGIALAAVFGFGAGLVFGIVSGELTGTVNKARVRRAVHRLRPGTTPDDDDVERRILEVLRTHVATRDHAIDVRDLGEGLIELTGTVPDEGVRDTARDLALGVTAGGTVVNRVLVDGVDTPEGARLELVDNGE